MDGLGPSTSGCSRSAAGGGAGAGSSGGLGGLGGNSAGAGSTSLLNLSGAGASGLGGGLGASGTAESAGTLRLVLLVIVLVQGESELVRDRTHAVSTVHSSSAVGIHAAAVSEAADSVQKGTELGVAQAGLRDTGGGIIDAAT